MMAPAAADTKMTTAWDTEYLAKIILEKSMEIFNSERVKVRSIEINETCTSGVTLYAKDF